MGRAVDAVFPVLKYLILAFPFFRIHVLEDNFYLLQKKKKQHELWKDLSVLYQPEGVLHFV